MQKRIKFLSRATWNPTNLQGTYSIQESFETYGRHTDKHITYPSSLLLTFNKDSEPACSLHVVVGTGSCAGDLCTTHFHPGAALMSAKDF